MSSYMNQLLLNIVRVEKDTIKLNMRILILGYTSLKKDPRIIRQIQALESDHELGTVGVEAPDQANLEFFKIGFKNKARQRAVKLVLSYLNRDALYKYNIQSYNRLFRELKRFNPEVIIANDYQMLPLGGMLKRATSAKLLFDAHEYYLDYDAVDSAFSLRLHKSKVESIFRKYFPLVDKLTTVSDGIAGLYKDNFGLVADIIDNSPDYVELEPSKVVEPIKLVHQGGALRKRRLENLIEAVRILGERYELHFYLVPSEPQYLEELKAQSTDLKVFFHEPAPMHELPRMLNQYDIGVYSLPEKNLNQKYAMPNKVFEFIQARLAVAISPTEAMKNFIEHNELGIVSHDFTSESLAQAISGVSSEQWMQYKQNANIVSKAYNRQANGEKLKKIIMSM